MASLGYEIPPEKDKPTPAAWSYRKCPICENNVHSFKSQVFSGHSGTRNGGCDYGEPHDEEAIIHLD